MNRLKIMVINNTGTQEFMGCNYTDVSMAMGFLRRASHLHKFSVLAVKGRRCMFFERVDLATIQNDINNFSIQS